MKYRFKTPAKLLAFASLESSIYQSGKLKSSGSIMVKRGFTYLRWYLQAASLISTREILHLGNIKTKRKTKENISLQQLAAQLKNFCE
ncbi:MAG: transposase [Fusobacterium sp.]